MNSKKWLEKVLALSVFLTVVPYFLDQSVLAQEAPSVAPVRSQGAFDQLIIFNGPAGDFATSFAKAALVRFDTRAALDSIAHGPMKPGVSSAKLANHLKIGIARHIVFEGSKARIDDLNSNHSYIVDCAALSVVDLDHDANVATQTALPDELTRWVLRNSIRLRAVPPKILAKMHRTEFPDGVQFTFDAPSVPDVVTDSFAYRYRSEMPEMECDVLDSNRTMLIAGPLSPLTNLLMYMEEFNKKGETLDGYGLNRIPNEGNNFSREDFVVGTLGQFSGSIVRGNFTAEVNPGAFDIPAAYRLVSVGVKNAGEHLPP